MDALRASMMLLGVVFHSALPFVTFRGVMWFHDASRHFGFDVLVIFLHSFRMPAFFMAAGFFAALLRDRRGVGAMARNRFQRIVVPLIIGWVVLAPLMLAAYRFSSEVAASGSIAAGVDRLRASDWLEWGTIFHLWFLLALLVLYPIGVAGRWAVSRLPDSLLNPLVAIARRFLVSPWRALILAIVIACLLIPAQFYRFDSINFFLAATMILFFALGWVVYAQVDLLPMMGRYAWAFLAVAIAATPVLGIAERTSLLAARGEDVWLPKIVAGGATSVVCAFMVFAVLGLFVTYSSRPSALVRYLSDSSYWIYLVHLPLILVIGGLLAATPLPSLAKMVLTLLVAVPILLFSYHFGVRFTPIGTLLNGRRLRRDQAAAVASR